MNFYKHLNSYSFITIFTLVLNSYFFIAFKRCVVKIDFFFSYGIRNFFIGVVAFSRFVQINFVSHVFYVCFLKYFVYFVSFRNLLNVMLESAFISQLKNNFCPVVPAVITVSDISQYCSCIGKLNNDDDNHND